MIDKNALLRRADALNKMAAQGFVKDGLPLYEQEYYLAMLYTYRLYRAGEIDLDEAKKKKQELTERFIDNAYKNDLANEYADRLSEFQKLQHEIHTSGCPVCKKLNAILCGWGENNEQTIQSEA